MALNDKINILFAEDEPFDQELAERALKEGGVLFNSKRVDTEAEFLKAIDEFIPDIVISDYDMPTFDGMSALKITLSKKLDIPFIILTGALNENIAVDCMKAGADDYVIKQSLSRLAQAVESAIEKKNTIRAKKMAETALRDSEQRFRSSFEASSIGMAIANKTGYFLSVNKAACEMFEYSKEEFLSLNFAELTHPIDKERSISRFKQCIKEKTAFTIEKSYLTKNGDTKIGITTISPIYGVNGVFLYGIAHIQDITKRKKAQNQLIESERKVKTLLGNLPGMAYRCLLTPGYKMEYVSDGCFELTGYKIEELVDNKIVTFGDLIHPNDRKKVWEIVNSAVEKEEQFELEYRIIDKNKKRKWVWERGICIQSGSENNILEGFITDITERKIAREKISERERKYRLLAENAVDVIWQMDLKLKFTYTSPSIYPVFGFKPEEWIGSKLSEHATTKEFFKMARQALRAIKDYKKFNYVVFEAKMLRKDGREIPVEISGRLLFNKNGLPSGLQGSTRNITERKLAEAEIIAMDNKLKLAMSAAKEGLWEWNLKTDDIYQDDTILEMLGYSRKEFVGDLKKGRWWMEQIHPEDKKLRDETFNKYLNGEINEYNVDFRVKKKQGKYIWVKSIAKIVDKDDDNQSFVIGVYRDITDSKNAEELLHEKEIFLESLLNAIPIPVFYKDNDGRYIGFNNAFINFFDIKPYDRIGKTVFDFNSSELAEIYFKKDKELLSKGGVQKYEGQVDDAKGIRHDVIFNKAVFNDNVGNINGLIGAILDITDLKKAEKELLQKNNDLFEAKEHSEKSEKSLKEAQSIAKLGNWELDLKTNQLYWSDEMYRVFEIEPSKFEGTYEGFLDRIHIDDKFMVIQAFLEHLNDAQPFDVDFKIYLTSGYEKHVQQKCHSEFNSEGKAIKSFGTIQDITALKQVEEKLLKLNKELEQRVQERTAEIRKLSEAVIHSPTIVIITNPDGVIEYINPKFTEVTGYTLDETVGKNPRLLNSGFHEQKFFENLWDTIKLGEVWQGEVCNKKKNGEIFWEHTSISSIKAKDKQITHFVAVKEDITLRKQMEVELTKAKEEAEVANKAKSEFLANMSHEIRTPMNAVLGFADLLSNMVTDELQKNYLESIKSSGKSLLTLINDILDLSKIEAGKLELQYTFVDLYDIFNEMKSIFSLTSEEKGLEFVVDVGANIPPLVLIDEIRLRQIIINLLSNAFKFTSRGHITLSAKAEHITQNDKKNNYCNLLIEVEDSGIGITEESRNKIFDSFSQQEGQSTKKYGGTGLGLTISRRLVDLMNGQIEVTSEVNKGSTFSIRFEKIGYTEDRSEKREKAKIDVKTIKFLGSKILVVDDIADNRRYLAGSLINYNLDVMQASDGDEVMVLLKAQKPDLIITDLRMPNVDGFQLKELLEKNNNFSDIPVIATSASAMKNSVEKVDRAGFSGFLIKPFQTKELVLELIKHIPYESVQEKALEVVNYKKMDKLNIKDSAFFFNRLDGLVADFSPLKEQQAMNDVELFAIKCIEFAKEFDIETLLEYGNNLNTAVKSFDIELMLNLINRFNELHERIRESVNE